MKKKIEIPKIKLDPLPFFKDGTLIFKESGHKLRISDRHYRCDLNCQGKCKLGEHQFKIENLQRNFLTLLEKFEITVNDLDGVLDRLMRDNLVDILLGPEKETRGKEQIMEDTLAVVAQDLQNGEKMKKSDIKDFMDSYTQARQIDYSIILAGMAFDVLRADNPKAQERLARAKTFSRIVKHVYLSNEGEILEIEFEPWGWYLIRLINRNVFGYIDSIRKKIDIVNDSDELEGKKLSEAAMYFAKTKPDEALGQNVSASKDWIILISGMIKSMTKNDVETAQKTQLILLGMMQNLPIAGMLATIAPAMEQKPKLRK